LQTGASPSPARDIRPFYDDWPYVDGRLHQYLDFFRSLGYERMHNIHLGVTQMLCDMFQEQLQTAERRTPEILNSSGEHRTLRAIRQAILVACNDSLSWCDRESPYPGFRVDFAKGKSTDRLNGLFTRTGITGMLEARHMHHILQAMPFLAALRDRMCGEKASCATTKLWVQYAEICQIVCADEESNKTFESFSGLTSVHVTALQQRITAFMEQAVELYGGIQASGMGTNKFHLLTHIPEDILRTGCLSVLDAAVFEASHKLVKHAYRATSRRRMSTVRETLSRMSRTQALRERASIAGPDATLPGPQARSKRMTLAGSGAIAADCATLVRKGVTIRIGDLDEIIKNQSPTEDAPPMIPPYPVSVSSSGKETEQSSGDGAQTDGGNGNPVKDWSKAEALVEELGDEAIAQFLGLMQNGMLAHISGSAPPRGYDGTTQDITQAESSQRSLVSERMAECLKRGGFLRVKSGISVSDALPDANDVRDYTHWEEGVRTTETVIAIRAPLKRRIQRFVASPSYHGRARYDNVLIEHRVLKDGAGARTEIHLYVAKCLMLYHQSQYLDEARQWQRREGDNGRSVGSRTGTTGEQDSHLVFLRYYDVVPALDGVDRALGCIRLKWAQSADGYPWYDIQPASTIRGKVHVVRADIGLSSTKSWKDCVDWRGEIFYINRFKRSSEDETYEVAEENA